MPPPFPSNPDVENERRSLLSLGKLRRIASLKRVVERADVVARSPISRVLNRDRAGERTHEVEPTQP
jgi:hypothetical protein